MYQTNALYFGYMWYNQSLRDLECLFERYAVESPSQGMEQPDIPKN
jgi:hypothetical protein